MAGKNHIYKGTFIDPTTFVDKDGNPYELKVSNFPPGKGPEDQEEEEQPKGRIDRKTGRKQIYDPRLKKWRDLKWQ